MESAAPSQIAIDYAKEETYLPEIDPEWFSMSLPKLSVPKSEDIVLPFIEAGKKSFRLRMSSNHFWDELRNMSLLLNSSRIWNKNFIKNSFINGNDYFKDFEDDLLVFTPGQSHEIM